MVFISLVSLLWHLSALRLAFRWVRDVGIEVVDHIVFAYSGSHWVFFAALLDERVVAYGFVVVDFGVMPGDLLNSAFKTAVVRPFSLLGF